MTRARADEYRRLAQECFETARSVGGELRAALIERAEYWSRLAKQQDEATDFDQPVMQPQCASQATISRLAAPRPFELSPAGTCETHEAQRWQVNPTAGKTG
jgi:hypothetical protein